MVILLAPLIVLEIVAAYPRGYFDFDAFRVSAQYDTLCRRPS